MRESNMKRNRNIDNKNHTKEPLRWLQWVKWDAAQTDNLSSTAGMHMVEGERADSLKLPSDFHLWMHHTQDKQTQ